MCRELLLVLGLRVYTLKMGMLSWLVCRACWNWLSYTGKDFWQRKFYYISTRVLRGTPLTNNSLLLVNEGSKFVSVWTVKNCAICWYNNHVFGNILKSVSQTVCLYRYQKLKGNRWTTRTRHKILRVTFSNLNYAKG